MRTKRLKGTKRLNKVMTKTLRPFGISKTKLGNDYGYFLYNSNIEFRLIDETKEDKWFNEFCEEEFGYTVRNNFIISLLHEIGHHKTLWDIYENMYLEDFCLDEKARIDAEIATAKDEAEVRKLEFDYFRLPDEYLATRWAVEYAKTHEKELDEMWDKMRKVIIWFYLKNKVITKEMLKK